MRPSEQAAAIASVIFVPPAALELVRLATNVPWPGFVPLASMVVSALLLTTWVAASAGMALRRSWGWYALCAGAMACFGHAMVLLTSTNRVGLIDLAAAVSAVVLARKALPAFAVEGTRVHRRSERPDHGSSTVFHGRDSVTA